MTPDLLERLKVRPHQTLFLNHQWLRLRAQFGVCPVSPLTLPKGTTEAIVAGARAGVPQNIGSLVMAGGTGPVTLAGTMIIHNAEVLSSITLAQLTVAGTPVIYGSSSTILDLRYGVAAVGSPETALLSAAQAIVARQYRLPSFVAGA